MSKLKSQKLIQYTLWLIIFKADIYPLTIINISFIKIPETVNTQLVNYEIL